jgi:hypothetical protein
VKRHVFTWAVIAVIAAGSWTETAAQVAADVIFGLRVNTLQGELTFKGPDVTRNQDKTCV